MVFKSEVSNTDSVLLGLDLLQYCQSSSPVWSYLALSLFGILFPLREFLGPAPALLDPTTEFPNHVC